MAAALPADVEAQVESDLVVAAPTGVELGPGRAGQFGDPALDGRVDVLVERQERERAAVDLGLHPAERGGHDRPLLLGEEPDAGQHVDVGPGAGEVVGRQPRVEREALGELEEFLRRGVAEAALPQRLPRFGSDGSLTARAPGVSPGLDCDPGAGAPWRRAHVSTDRPQRRTKPSASR